MSGRWLTVCSNGSAACRVWVTDSLHWRWWAIRSGRGSSQLLPLHPPLLGAGPSSRHRHRAWASTHLRWGAEHINRSHKLNHRLLGRFWCDSAKPFVWRRIATSSGLDLGPCGGASFRPLVVTIVMGFTPLTGWLTDAQRGSVPSPKWRVYRSVYHLSCGLGRPPGRSGPQHPALSVYPDQRSGPDQ